MDIVAKGVVFAGQKGSERQSAAFPGICIQPSGRWLCAFRASPHKAENKGQHTLVVWSDDEGRTWSEPRQCFHAPLIDGRPGFIRTAYLSSTDGKNCVAVLCWVDASNPHLPFFNPETEGLLDCKILLSRSEDDGETWSEPRLLSPQYYNVPTPVTGPVLQLGNGDWLCQFELNKPYDAPGQWEHASVLVHSSDGGIRWQPPIEVSRDPSNRIYYWDQRPGELGDGKILNVFWTYDNVESAYLNIHARLSHDYGRTWSAMWDTGVSGQPAPPVTTADGRIAMVYVDRSGSVPCLKARISDDDGGTWPANTETLLYERPFPVGEEMTRKGMNDAWLEMSDFATGLPATASLNGKEMVVVYYTGPHSNYTAIEWMRVRF